MGMLRIAVWDNHFGKRKSVEDWADFVLGLIEVADVVEDDPFSVVEANMDRPILPFNCPTFHGEANTFWLGDVDGLQISSEATLLLD